MPDLLGIGDANEYELYDAMDWLQKRQGNIEKKLAARHLKDWELALDDLTSGYFKGLTCPLACLGHSRNGKKGKLQVNYGLLATEQGVPIAVSVQKPCCLRLTRRVMSSASGSSCSLATGE